MDCISRKRFGGRPAATLFDGVNGGVRGPAAFHERVRTFASEVAKRHRRQPGDLGAMLVALRGWHRTWSIVSPELVPALDERSIALAVAAYKTRAGSKHHGSAA